jgi:hypothetical protein
MINEAIKLHQLGFKVIPTDNDKRPKCQWKAYQDSQSLEDVKSIFNGHNGSMALLTGKGIEVIDIDTKYFLEHHDITKLWDAFFDVLGEETYSKLLITQTQSGGYHCIYRTAVSEGNQKLASRYTIDSEKKGEHDKVRVLLETRGENGYILIPPSEGYTFDSPLITFENIPTLTDHERNCIIAVCREFDEIEETYTQTKAPIAVEVLGSGKSTIEAFNEAHTPIEFLESHGWQFKYQRGDNLHYVRAGKTLREGISAGYSQKLNLVRVFTSSTEFECNKSYNAFQTYAILEHRGDYSKASKELYHSGYGDRMSKTTDSHKQQVREITSSDKKISGKAGNNELMESIFSKKLDITIKPPKQPSTLFMFDEEKQDYVGIAGDGDLVNFFGREKTGKSSAAACAASCYLVGGTNNSLKFRAEFGNRNLVHFDTEQSEYDHHKLSAQMMFQQGLSTKSHPSNFFGFFLMPYTKIDRLNFIRYSIDKIPNIGCVFIDGIVDVCRNYNDLEESSDLVTFFMNIAASRKFLIIDVLHNARSTGSARGHLGTELLNKAKCNINVTREDEAQFSTLKVQSVRGVSAPKGFDFWHNEQGNISIY